MSPALRLPILAAATLLAGCIPAVGINARPGDATLRKAEWWTAPEDTSVQALYTSSEGHAGAPDALIGRRIALGPVTLLAWGRLWMHPGAVSPMTYTISGGVKDPYVNDALPLSVAFAPTADAALPGYGTPNPDALPTDIGPAPDTTLADACPAVSVSVTLDVPPGGLETDLAGLLPDLARRGLRSPYGTVTVSPGTKGGLSAVFGDRTLSSHVSFGIPVFSLGEIKGKKSLGLYPAPWEPDALGTRCLIANDSATNVTATVTFSEASAAAPMTVENMVWTEIEETPDADPGTGFPPADTGEETRYLHAAVPGEWRLFAAEIAWDPETKTTLVTSRMVLGDGTLSPYAIQGTGMRFFGGDRPPVRFDGTAARTALADGRWYPGAWWYVTFGQNAGYPFYIDFRGLPEGETALASLIYGQKLIYAELTDAELLGIFRRDRSRMQALGIWTDIPHPDAIP